MYELERKQIVEATVEECWDFFSDPSNLRAITPESLDFRIVSALPERIYAGLMIEYRVRPLFGIPVTWLTEITHVREGEMFVDEQRVGPYRVWHHEHTFRAAGNGRTECRDKVTYVPPLGPLGALAHPMLIRPQLERIFAHRAAVVPGLLGRGVRRE